MGSRQARARHSRLEGVRRRFERWRQTRKVLSRIPEPLWAAAAKVAGASGISHTAKTLRVNHHALEKRIAEAATTSDGPGRGAADQRRPLPTNAARRCPSSVRSVPAFLELAPAARTGSCQCMLEFEDASGAKMRVHLQGAEAPDLAALSRSFWELRS
jgi:hypothetical protein